MADTGNNRVRQTGPAPLSLGVTPTPHQVLLSCHPGRAIACERLPVPKHPVALPFRGPVTVTYQGTTFASGRWLRPDHGRLQFLLTEAVPLVPGGYQLGLRLGNRNISVPITITPRP